MDYVVCVALLASLVVALFDLLPPRLTVFRRGGLYFWRIGRLGGSVFLTRSR